MSSAEQPPPHRPDGSTAPAQAAVEALRARIHGPVLTPGDAAYAPECAGFNSAIRHTPDVVVGVSSEEDVVACVHFARAQRLEVHVQGGGHGAEAAIPSGLLVSTRRLDDVRIDPAARLAVVGAGTRWDAVIARASEHGLAPITGSSATVGVVGFLLGGGLGPLARSHGFGSDYVAGARVVTASGAALDIDADQNPELLWAFRGGKGGFGIVTEVRLRLVPLRSLYGGSLFFDAPHVENAFRAWVGWTEKAPPLVTTSVALARFPSREALPPPLRGRRLLVLRFAFPGDAAEGARLAAPLRGAAPIYIDQLAEMAARDIAKIHNDPTEPIPSSVRATMLRPIDQTFAGALLSHLGPAAESPFTVAEIRHLGEATRRDVPEGSAVGGRESSFTLSCICTDPTLFESAVPAAYDALRRDLAAWISTDNNVNFLAPIRSSGDFARAWPAGTFSRLAKLRKRYDPDGLFAFGPRSV